MALAQAQDTVEEVIEKIPVLVPYDCECATYCKWWSLSCGWSGCQKYCEVKNMEERCNTCYRWE